MSRLRVLHFMGSGRIGGQERAQYQLFKALLADGGLDLAVALAQDIGLYAEKIKTLDLPILQLNMKSGFDLGFKPALIREMKGYDIHHLHDPSPNQIIYSLLAGSRVKRCLTRRGGLFSYPRTAIKKRLKFTLKKLLYKRFDAFSANSGNAIVSLRRQYGIDWEITLLYNGIDFGLLTPQRLPAEMRNSLGLTGEEFVVGTASRLVDFKRIDLLIRAFARAAIAEKKLVICGQGKEMGHLRSLAGNLCRPGQVIFTGEVPHLPDFHQLMDCFVLPSSSAESFGNAVVEAMYGGIPGIIMADSAGLLEHIRDGQTGYVARDENDLATIIERIYKSPSEAGQIAAQGRQYVVQKYSLANMVRAYTDFYLRVLSGQEGKG